MRFSDLILSITAPTILVVLIVVFLRRRYYRELPFFFVYIVYAPIATLRVLSDSWPSFHFVLYWITESLYGILALLVLREVFHRLFALPYAAFRWFRLLLPGTVLVILSISLWETSFRPLAHGQIGRLVSAIYWFDLGVHALEGMILLLVLALTIAFPIRWRDYEFGILIGFGVSACVTMLADLLRFEGGSSYETFFRYGPPIAYVLAALVWLHAFLRPPASLPRPQIDHHEMLEVIRRSRELLEKIEKALGLRHRLAVPPI